MEVFQLYIKIFIQEQLHIHSHSIRFALSIEYFVVVSESAPLLGFPIAQFTDDFLFSTRLLLHFAVARKSISLLPCRISCYLLCIVMIRCLAAWLAGCVAATAPHWLMLHASQPVDEAQCDLASPQSLFLMCRLFSFQFYSIFNSFYSAPPPPVCISLFNYCRLISHCLLQL